MKAIVALVFAGLVAACVSAQVTHLVTTRYEPTIPDQVTVLADISELDADTIRYERIAVITTSGDGSGMTDQADMLNKVREEAAKIGANAVILSGYNQGEFYNEGSAIAIRYEIVRDSTGLGLRRHP